MEKIHYALFLLLGLNFILAGLALATVQGAYNQEIDNHRHPTLSIPQSNAVDVRIDKAIGPEFGNMTVFEYIDTTLASFYEARVTSQTNHLQLEHKCRFDSFLNHFICPDIVNSESQSDSTPQPQPSPQNAITLDKDEYNQGEVVRFSGVGPLNVAVIISISAPGGEQKQIANLWSGPEGIFAGVYVIPGNADTGTYRIIAQAGTVSLIEPFTVK